MEFLIMLVVNIFIATVFYLIISLKLERSASEFREEKLKKEMDKIIKEFNLTADRNISLLENKIAIMKRLLNKAGDLESIDITIDEFQNVDSNKQRVLKRDSIQEFIEPDKAIATVDKKQITENHSFEKFLTNKKSLILLSKNYINNLFNRLISSIPERSETKKDKPNDRIFNLDYKEDEIIEDSVDVSIEKDLSDISHPESINQNNNEEDIIKFSEKEILDMLEDSDDKYSIIFMLHEKGYPIESISSYSGVPIGEIKLILNLRST